MDSVKDDLSMVMEYDCFAVLNRCEKKTDYVKGMFGRMIVYKRQGSRNHHYPVADFLTLERPWADNRRLISSIPVGLYNLSYRQSNKFGRLLPYLDDVPDRYAIMIHPGNTIKDTSGCILLGQFESIDLAILRGSVTYSVNAVKEFVELKPDCILIL